MDSSQFNSKLNKSILITTASFIVVFPLLFLPNINNQFHLPKTILAILTSIILLTFYTISSLKRRKLDINFKASFIPVIVFVLAYIGSSYFQSNNPMQALGERTILLISLTLIYLVSSSVLTKKHLTVLTYSLITGSTLAAVLKICQPLFTGSFASLWSSTGSPTSFLALIMMGIALCLGLIIKNNDHNGVTTKIILTSVLVFNLFIGIFLISQIISGKASIVNLPYSIGYQISIDILKHPSTALLGVGPDNFLPAFTLLRPRSYNDLPSMWSFRPAYSSNEFFQTMTTTGLVGVIGLILISLFLMKNIIRHWETTPAITAVNIVVIITLLLIPANTAIFGFLFIILIINSLTDDNKPLVTLRSPTAALISGLVFIIVQIASLTLITRFTLADYYFAQAAKPNSDQRFQLITKAKINNSYNSNYFVAYSNLAIELAESISKHNNGKVTDKDGELIKNLIEEAIPSINHAAYKLNNQDPTVWEARARMMRRISTVVPAATQEAVKSYNLALALDNKNPLLHLEFGQYLQSLKDYDTAKREFEISANLKSKYANPLFNLALLYDEQKNYTMAESLIKQTLTLVPSTETESYNKAIELQNKIKEQMQNQPQATSQTEKPTTSNQIEPGSLNKETGNEINLQEGQVQLPTENSILPIPSISPVTLSPTPSITTTP